MIWRQKCKPDLEEKKEREESTLEQSRSLYCVLIRRKGKVGCRDSRAPDGDQP